jgi:23S rRNA pseudouridine2605 synthase
VSLARALSKLGAASRSQAERLVQDGRVSVRGVVVLDPSRRVDPDRDDLRIDGEPVARRGVRHVAFHKPEGVVTTRSDERGRRTLLDVLPEDLHALVPVGRLDRDSSGLLLLTSDTRWADAITSPRSHVEKAYEVELDAPLDAGSLARLQSGVEIDGRATRPCSIRDLGPSRVEVVLTEGRNRQVRRMMEAAGRRVLRLVRTRIGALELGDLAPGAWRDVDPDEVRRSRTEVAPESGVRPDFPRGARTRRRPG